jgi:RecA/RadA recombinase
MAEKNFLKELKKINAYAGMLKNHEFGTITDYISTGSLVLNAKTSGDMFKGIPAGRITVLQGKSGVGKSFIAGSIVREGMAKGYKVIWLDTEIATDEEFAERLGIDTSKLYYVPGIPSVEELRNQTLAMIKLFGEEYPNDKLLLVIDSLGNLASEKELKDATAGKNASDMGQRAKVIKSVFRTLTPELLYNKVTTVIVNHTYSDPTNPYIEEKASGGEGAVYNPALSINLAKTKIKTEDKEVIGTLLKALPTKNRLVPSHQLATIKLLFENGLDKYYGLLDIALEVGLVIKDGKRYKNVIDDKLMFEKNIYTAEFWEPILEDLNKKYSELKTYSAVDVEEVIKEFIEED